jgi:hypothetical protein
MDMSDHQPVEEHPQRSEMLFHRWLGVGALQRLNIGRDVNRLYLRQVE